MQTQQLDDSVVEDLLLIARGDFNLVEESLVKSLRREERPWWKFWGKHRHFIDFKDAVEYIIKERNKIDNMEIGNAESPTV